MWSPVQGLTGASSRGAHHKSTGCWARINLTPSIPHRLFPKSLDSNDNKLILACCQITLVGCIVNFSFASERWSCLLPLLGNMLRLLRPTCLCSSCSVIPHEVLIVVHLGSDHGHAVSVGSSGSSSQVHSRLVGTACPQSTTHFDNLPAMKKP